MGATLRAAVLTFGFSAVAGAAPLAYTDEATFLADVAAGGLTPGSQDFDSVNPGFATGVMLQTSGALTVTITMPGPLPNVLGGANIQVAVVAAAAPPFDPGTHVLGTIDPDNFDQFISNTPLTFNFQTPVTAFGLTLISPDSPTCCLFDGDVQLTVAAAGAPAAALDVDADNLLFTLNPGPGQTELHGYFLGVNAEAPFTSATLSYSAAPPNGGFFFVLDDLQVAAAHCTDGLDNDGDGHTDAPSDPGCDAAGDTSERSDLIECDDGIDNDGDGRIDHDPVTIRNPGGVGVLPAGVGDPACGTPNFERGEASPCQDGLNNDGDPGVDWDGGFFFGGSGPADRDCENPWDPKERRTGKFCGLGFELVLILVPLGWLPCRRRGRSRRTA